MTAKNWFALLLACGLLVGGCASPERDEITIDAPLVSVHRKFTDEGKEYGDSHTVYLYETLHDRRIVIQERYYVSDSGRCKVQTVPKPGSEVRVYKGRKMDVETVLLVEFAMDSKELHILRCVWLPFHYDIPADAWDSDHPYRLAASGDPHSLIAATCTLNMEPKTINNWTPLNEIRLDFETAALPALWLETLPKHWDHR